MLPATKSALYHLSVPIEIAIGANPSPVGVARNPLRSRDAPQSLLPQAQPGYDYRLIPALVRGRHSLIMEEHTMRPR